MFQFTKHVFTYLLLLTTFVAVAQTPKPSAERMLDQLNEKLELSDKQYKQVKAHVLEQREQIQAVRSNDNIEPAEKLKSLKEVRAGFDTKMKDILEAEQYERYLIMKAEGGKSRRGEMKKGQRGERPSPEEIEKKRAAMKEQRKVMEPKVHQLRTDFDKEISRKDRKELKKLRVFYEAKRAEHKAEREKMKASGERPSKEEMKQRMDKQKKAESPEAQKLEKLAAKYQDAVKAAIDANTEIKEYMQDREKANAFMRDGRGGGRFAMGRNNGKGKEKMEKAKLKMVQKFLLIEPKK